MEEKIQKRFAELREATEKTKVFSEIVNASRIITDALLGGKKILACGNGGSMEQAQHLVGEFAGRFKIDRKPFAAVALGANADLLTAIANDFDYTKIFSRELEAIGCAGDVLMALSTSGNSPNVIEAVAAAKKLGIKTIGLTGNQGKLKSIVDVPLCVNSSDTPRIQEVHLLIIHVISEIVEEAMETEFSLG